MHCAAMNGHLSTVKLLGDLGLDYEIKNNAGSTPLHYAGTFFFGKIFQYHSLSPFFSFSFCFVC